MTVKTSDKTSELQICEIFHFFSPEQLIAAVNTMESLQRRIKRLIGVWRPQGELLDLNRPEITSPHRPRHVDGDGFRWRRSPDLCLPHRQQDGGGEAAFHSAAEGMLNG